VQALHLAQHAGTVVATDVNPRALAMARLTAALNEVEVDVRDGSLFEPVAGETFDLIATNPPFVISPPGSEVLVYRDSGMPGDSVVRHLVENAETHLNEGGWCQILANWAHHDDVDWQDDLGRWLDGRPLDAWVLQRELVDPAAYVEMWLADAGLAGAPDYIQRYDAWLAWFAGERIDDRRDRAARRARGRGLGQPCRRRARGRRRRPARAHVPPGGGPRAGDPRRGRRGRSREHRRPAAARGAPRTAGRHRRGRPRRRKRRRPDVGADPRRAGLPAGP
jgi:hypothetical protein